MSAIEPLYRMLGIEPSVFTKEFTKEEHILLEVYLFSRIYEELQEIFRAQHREYFRLMKFTKTQEDIMLEAKLARLLIQDILSTHEYDQQGIARYTGTFDDVVEDVILGRNTSPSATFLRRLIELHA